MRQLSWTALCMLLVLACEDSAGPGTAARVHIVRGGGTDTIDVVDTLVVVVGNSLGLPAPGVEVEFRAQTVAGEPLSLLTLYLRPCFCLIMRDTTDARGQASIEVGHGPVAGDAMVAVRATGSEGRDSARFTTTPGAPIDSRVSPQDRPITLDSAYQLTATLVDRYQNTIPAATTFATASPEIELSPSGLVRGRSIGRARVELQVGAFSDSAFTTVVPPAILAIRDYSGFVGDSMGYSQMLLDGSHYRRLFNTELVPTEYSPSNHFAPQWIGATGQLAHLRTIAGVPRLFVGDSTGSVRRLIESPGDITAESDFEVSADGAWVYFVGHAATGSDVWRVSTSGGVPERLTTTTGVAFRSISVSPDGTRLAFASSASGIMRPYVLDLSTGDTLRLGSNEAAGVRWSPAGDWILYAVSAPHPGYSGHLRIVHPDGTGDQELSDGAYFPGGSWSPDGAWVLVVRADLPRHELIDVATGTRLPLAYGRAWYGPAWRR